MSLLYYGLAGSFINAGVLMASNLPQSTDPVARYNSIVIGFAGGVFGGTLSEYAGLNLTGSGLELFLWGGLGVLVYDGLLFRI